MFSAANKINETEQILTGDADVQACFYRSNEVMRKCRDQRVGGTCIFVQTLSLVMSSFKCKHFSLFYIDNPGPGSLATTEPMREPAIWNGPAFRHLEVLLPWWIYWNKDGLFKELVMSCSWYPVRVRCQKVKMRMVEKLNIAVIIKATRVQSPRVEMSKFSQFHFSAWENVWGFGFYIPLTLLMLCEVVYLQHWELIKSEDKSSKN